MRKAKFAVTLVVVLSGLAMAAQERVKREPRLFALDCAGGDCPLLKGEQPLQIATWLGDTLETVVKHYLPLSVAICEKSRNTLERRDVGIEAMQSVMPKSTSRLVSQWVA